MRGRSTCWAVAALVMAAGLAVDGQTVITPPENKYTPAEDVQLGREAAVQVEQQMPILHDDAITAYVAGIGERLVRAVPANLQHDEFHYTFKVVNVREINAFALPGGPMYINRGMIEAAHTEGEIAGVMAHEMSHVALRHGTAQSTKATPYQIGQIAGAVLGAVIGGRVGNVVSQGTQFGIGTAFLRFSREFEKQADLLGTHIMADAGYDPHDMANVFKTIEKQGGSGGPQWLSDHPNPGNRYEYINQEAALLHVRSATHDTAAFEQTQARLKRMSPAPTTEQATKNGAGRTAPSEGAESRPSTSVARPASRYTTYNEGNVFTVGVPSNWREVAGSDVVTFAPEGATGVVNRQSVFTHGVQIGIARNETHDLQTATAELVESLTETNPRLSRAAGSSRATIGGRRGLRTPLSNVSDVTGADERIAIYTTLMSDGNLFYLIGVSPAGEASAYDGVFRKVVGSIRFVR